MRNSQIMLCILLSGVTASAQGAYNSVRSARRPATPADYSTFADVALVVVSILVIALPYAVLSRSVQMAIQSRIKTGWNIFVDLDRLVEVAPVELHVISLLLMRLLSVAGDLFLM
ncbi:hypothetical protein RvY_18654 [Ramazzottius varieornatus]|uniref:Uncharacterized protein n=1 Tax=Ramazzottius varieornatus TaxID=947166 RepID=A0A1D1WAT0_RAMVA|nr:hypothetical protein RvY_18654 [Ramazzottius varieornatus]